MIGKVEIDEAKKERIIDKAAHLTDEFGAIYYACAVCTFEGICEAFRSEGIELYPPETQEIIKRGMLGLAAGVAESGVGTCGAITASAFVISSVVDVSTDEVKKHWRVNSTVSIPIQEYVIDRFEETYGAIDCLRLRYNRTQRATDFLDPDAMAWELLFSAYEPNKCGMSSDLWEGGRDQAMPVNAARWTAEAICDLLALEPEERKKIPSYLVPLGREEIAPKVQKVVEALKELGFGYPNEKISYREHRTFKLKGKKGLEKSRPGKISAPKK
jgi:hypothetical protein